MFLLLLGINAVTDWREGCVYDGFSLLLFGYAVIHSAAHGMGQWFAVVLLLLLVLRAADRKEQILGRGDYLILLSVSLYFNDFPAVLIVTSAAALAVSLLQKRHQLPLVPYLFLGSVLVDARSCLHLFV